MPDTTPNLSTPDAQTPSNQMPNTSIHPSSAVAVTQLQSEYDNSMGAKVLLAPSQRMHEEIYDETLLVQTPNIQSPTQPIIAATTQASPKGVFTFDVSISMFSALSVEALYMVLSVSYPPNFRIARHHLLEAPFHTAMGMGW